MNSFICPVCKRPLKLDGKTYKCENRHSFDLSKSGYVNLLMSQQSKLKRHGDDKIMVNARRKFLDKGYYNHFSDALIKEVSKHYKPTSSILDAGCGEGFYTVNLFKQLSGDTPDILAVDISKFALDGFAKRNKEIKRAVASVYNLPIADNSCDIVVNVFAPVARDEFLRVLKPNGILITAIALQNHLYKLKSAVYDTPRKNGITSLDLSGFCLIENTEIKKDITLNSKEDIITLFKMTPYYYKTSSADFEKLENLNTLTTETHFGILTYKKAKNENE